MSERYAFKVFHHKGIKNRQYFLWNIYRSVYSTFEKTVYIETWKQVKETISSDIDVKQVLSTCFCVGTATVQ